MSLNIYRKILSLIALLLFMAVDLHAQTRKVTGTVRERGGEAMPGVMVTVRNVSDEPQSYTVTDKNGKYSLEYPAALKNGCVKFSCIGFRTVSYPLSEVKSRLDVTMDEEAFNLKEVVVRVPPINAKGDTLTYDVASFRSASDRNIEDVIKKLPGIRVTDEGRIYYNGETINKFYIEGLDALSGRYTLATRNISPNDVVSVNVYENHQPKRVLKDVEFSKNAALNLKLKNKRMLKPIGNVRGGIGVDTDNDMKWLGEIFAMLISPKHQTLVTAKGNDAGLSYMNETKVMISDGSADNKTEAYGTFPKTPFGSVKIPVSRYYDSRSYTGSVSTVTKLGEFTTLNVAADYSDEDNRYTNSEDVTYTNTGIRFNERAINNPYLREAKLRLGIENNATKRFLSDKLAFTGHFNSNDYRIENGGTVNQGVVTDDYNFRNQLIAILRISKSMFDFKSDVHVSNTPVNRLTATGDTLLPIFQSVKGLSFKTKKELGYSWFINSHSSISLKGMLDTSYELFKSNAVVDGENSYENHVRGYDITTTLTPKYQYQFNSGLTFNLSAPVRITNLKFDNRLTGKSYPIDRVDVDLRASVNYTTPWNIKTNLSAGRSTTLGGMTDYITEPIYITFRRRTTRGTGDLSERESYYATANMSYRSVIEGLFSSLNLLWRRGTSNQLRSMDVTPGEVISSTVSRDNHNDMINVGWSGSKKIFPWNTSFALNLNWERLNKDMIRQNRNYGMRTTNYVVQTTIHSSPVGDYLNMDLEVRYSATNQKVKMADIDNKSNDVLCNLFISSFPVKNLELSARGYFNYSELGNGVGKNSLFMDCGVTYHFRSFDIELTAKNLSNSKSYDYTYLLDSDVYSYSFALRPLEFLATLKYSF